MVSAVFGWFGALGTHTGTIILRLMPLGNTLVVFALLYICIIGRFVLPSHHQGDKLPDEDKRRSIVGQVFAERNTMKKNNKADASPKLPGAVKEATQEIKNIGTGGTKTDKKPQTPSVC